MINLTEKTEDELAKIAQDHLDRFKVRMKQEMEKVLEDVYIDCLPHITHDSWMNYRNVMREAYEKDEAKEDTLKPWGERIRKQIFKENKDEIVAALNTDLVERVKYLEGELNRNYGNYF